MGQEPTAGGAAHGARAHHRGAHNTAGGPQGGTTPRGAPAHRGVPPTRQQTARVTVAVAASSVSSVRVLVRAPRSGMCPPLRPRVNPRAHAHDTTGHGHVGRVTARGGLLCLCLCVLSVLLLLCCCVACSC